MTAVNQLMTLNWSFSKSFGVKSMNALNLQSHLVILFTFIGGCDFSLRLFISHWSSSFAQKCLHWTCTGSTSEVLCLAVVCGELYGLD